MSELSMNISPVNALSVRDPWALVPSLGNLDAYISAINRVPLLTQEEETEFAPQAPATAAIWPRPVAWSCRTCGWSSRSPASTWAMVCRTAT